MTFRLILVCRVRHPYVAEWPPAYLPSWSGFNETMLEEIKWCALSILPDGLAPLFERIRLSEKSVVGFSERIRRG